MLNIKNVIRNVMYINVHSVGIILGIKGFLCDYFSLTFSCHIINPLNAELNPICHLLVLLGDKTFMGPCIVSIFQYISNKMQRCTVYL
jgi:hypothetical protein